MGNWILAYNTNGFAHHRLEDALVILSELDYDGVAITLDVHHLDPYSPRHTEELLRIRDALQERELGCLIESGARFNLDFRRKHYPSLLCRLDRRIRIDFLARCIRVAAELGAPSVSLWSGHNFEGLAEAEAYDLLVDGLERVLEVAEAHGVDIGFEPEPGMFIETVDEYARLKARLPSSRFGLSLDVGHLLVTGECTIPEAIRRFRNELISVAVEDMESGVHRHLPFGEGDVDFDGTFGALEEIGYRGFVSVELSGESANASQAAARARSFLARF